MQQASTMAGTLWRLRTQRGLTLSGLSQHCGLARRLLQQIESGDAIPTLEHLWSLSHALEAPLGLFFQASDADGRLATFLSADQGTAIRLLEPACGPWAEETYSFEIQSGCARCVSPPLPSADSLIRVVEGALEVRYPQRTIALHAGQAHAFAADVEHWVTAPTQTTRGLLTLRYPGHDHLSGHATHRLDWPDSPLAWEGVQNMVERLLVDVCNGIGAALLRFRVDGRHISPINAFTTPDNGLAGRRFQADLEAHLPAHASVRHWPGHVWAGVDAVGPYIAILPMLSSRAFTRDRAERTPCADTVLLARAERFARHAETPHAALPDHVQRQFTRALAQPGWTLPALACEVSLQRGTLVIPSALHRHPPLIPTQAGTDTAASVPARADDSTGQNNDSSFSSRIDVRSYDAFELLHPAYARQAVAMAQDILDYAAHTLCHRSIDIGTGPGIPLLMLLELLPGMRTLALEPDDVAFACLQENTRDASRISLHQGDFLALDHPPGHVSLMTSTGASHHFHTARMFQKASELLRPGGVFCVADEFLPEFRTEQARKGALIQHHAAYIANTLAWIGSAAPAALSEDEARHYAAFSQAIPLALTDLHLGHPEQAVRRCRRLYCSLGQSLPPHAPAQHAIGMYIRFFWLELQAMVAGFDYEVECKTHPRRFVDMARSAGFELLRHRRLYATTGFDDWSGGTHLFTFAKPSIR